MTALRVSPGTLARLATTRFDPRDAAVLHAGLHSRRMVLLAALLTRTEDRGEDLPYPARARFEQYWRLLEAAEQRDAAAVRTTLDYPTVGAWLARSLTAPPGAAFADHAAHFGAVVAAAALRAGAGFRVRLPVRDGLVVLPGIGALRTDAPWVRLSAGPRGARFTLPGHRPGPELLRHPGRLSCADVRWRMLRPLLGSAAVVEDLDPYRVPAGGVGGPGAFAAHPATAGRPWRRRWRSALALTAAADPGRAAELTALLRCLVPLDGSGPGPRGATLRAAPGAVLATLPGTTEGFAGILVHEIQHTKLGVLTDLVPLHDAGPEAVYRVPWRSDLRPFGGVLQGTYAHLALADFWLTAARRPGTAGGRRRAAQARGEASLGQVARALPVLLQSDRLTCTGREFTVRMKMHHAWLGRVAHHSAHDDRHCVTLSDIQ